MLSKSDNNNEKDVFLGTIWTRWGLLMFAEQLASAWGPAYAKDRFPNSVLNRGRSSWHESEERKRRRAWFVDEGTHMAAM